MNYYQILELERTATATEIKDSYKKLYVKYHPDKNPDNKLKSEKKFNEMKNAYDVLSDPTRRQLYENYLLHSEQPPIAPPPPPNFNSQSTQTTNTTDLSKHKSLIELVLANDTAAIKRKLAENPDFNYLYNAWRIDNSGKTLNALDVAVRQGKFDIVKMLIAANYNISNIRSYYSEFAGGGGCTSSEKSYPTIVIAAVYYNKDIFDFLMNELQKPTKKTKSKNTINKKQWNC
jgi:curved DNA-binding protein CbpA